MGAWEGGGLAGGSGGDDLLAQLLQLQLHEGGGGGESKLWGLGPNIRESARGERRKRQDSLFRS